MKKTYDEYSSKLVRFMFKSTEGDIAMPARELQGIWIYRSFLNSPNAVGDFNKLTVWEAELSIEVDENAPLFYGHLGERPVKVKGEEPYLHIQGKFAEGTPSTVSWRAVGRKDSAFDGLIYDYTGVLNPVWPEGKDGNRPTIVGTVIRTVKHGEAPAGSVFSFIAIKRDFVEPRVRIPLKKEVLDLMGSLEHRLHHQLWHASRDEWADLSDAKKLLVRTHGWQPGPLNGERNATGPGRYMNGAGEDFLFMHRQMVTQVRAIESIDSWQSVPGTSALANFTPGFEATQVGNVDGYAIPEAWIVPGDPDTTHWLHELRRTSTLYGRFLVWQAQYTDPVYLSRITLGEMGARVEATIHNWMHMRWASMPRDPETDEPVPGGRAPLDFDAKWLKPEYDYLGETFSSHVNPIFWRLHGWVDDRIEDWFRAHEVAHPGEVRRIEKNGVTWFEPGKWVQVADPWSGPATHHDPSGNHTGHQAGIDLDSTTMEKVLSIIFGLEPGLKIASLIDVPAFQKGVPRATWFKKIDE